MMASCLKIPTINKSEFLHEGKIWDSYCMFKTDPYSTVVMTMFYPVRCCIWVGLYPIYYCYSRIQPHKNIHVAVKQSCWEGNTANNTQTSMSVLILQSA